MKVFRLLLLLICFSEMTSVLKLVQKQENIEEKLTNQDSNIGVLKAKNKRAPVERKLEVSEEKQIINRIANLKKPKFKKLIQVLQKKNPKMSSYFGGKSYSEQRKLLRVMSPRTLFGPLSLIPTGIIAPLIGFGVSYFLKNYLDKKNLERVLKQQLSYKERTMDSSLALSARIMDFQSKLFIMKQKIDDLNDVKNKQMREIVNTMDKIMAR